MMSKYPARNWIRRTIVWAAVLAGGPARGQVVFEEFTEAKAPSDVTSITISTPAGTTGGDLLITAIALDGNNAGTLVPPAGEAWTEVSQQASGGATLAVWYKVAGASESASHQFTWTATEQCYAWMMRFTGQHATPVHVFAENGGGNSSTPTAPSVTTTVADTLILRLGGFDDDDITLDDPGLAGHTPITMDASGTGINSCSGGAGYVAQPAPGSSGTADFVLTSGEGFRTVTLAIRAAACTVDPDCDDGNACTADACVAGLCQNTAEPVGTECRAAVGECDVAETCDGTTAPCPNDGFVSGGTPCTDSTPGDCDDAQCDGNGACDQVFAVEANGYVCRADNGGGCDVAETCDGASGGACPLDLGVSNGTECRASAGECDPAEVCDGTSAPCPSDLFVAAGTPCTDSTPTDCNDAQCDGNGACDQLFALEANGSTCDDGLACNVGETCQSGACTGGAAQDCTGTGDQCNADNTCDPAGAEGNCDTPGGAINEGLACDDGLACNVGETCQSGVCTGGAAQDCTGTGDQCNADNTCDPAGAEGNCDTPGGAINEGLACDDGLACNVGETCQTGVCTGGAPQDCTGTGDQCNADSTCDPAGAEGNCDTPGGAINEGLACDDGLACNVGETCQSGVCAGGAPQDCTGTGGQCSLDSTCDPAGAEGNCDTPGAAINEGLGCDDSLFCTALDLCRGGVCAGRGDACPGEACDEAGDVCFPCSTDPDCDDGSACTTDTCTAGVCTHDCGVSVSTYPDTENFETGFGDWVNATGDNFDWTRISGPTPTTGTGPSGDHTTGTGFYLFTEGSSPQVGGDRAVLESPCFDLSGRTTAGFSFWYHMFGTGIGILDVDVSEDCATWINVFRVVGNQGDTWLQGTLDLSAYSGGTVRLRFVGTRGSAATSDMAIDDLVFTASGCFDDGDCDDGNSCTVDVCNAGSCEYTPQTLGTVCRAAVGECDTEETCDGTTAPCPNDGFVASGTPCTDSTPDDCDDAQCDGNGACDQAFVVEANGYVCRADNGGGCDVAEICDGVSGGACPADLGAANGTECRATAGECDVAETCDGSSAPCPLDGFAIGGTPCTDSTPGDCNDAQCDGNGVCDPLFAFEGDGSSCDDGLACNVGETCQSGVCTGGAAQDCTGTGDQCNADSTCDPAGAEGNCDTPGGAINEGLACDDGLACNVGEICQSGVCTGGAPQDCTGTGGQCILDSTCDPAGAEGNCDTPGAAINEGLACDDSLFCTALDLCRDGVCAGRGDACPGEACDETGDVCFACSTNPDCDDGSACTTDTCTAGVCTHDCSTSIATYPYSETFEAGFGDWSNVAGDNFDWTRNSGSTPTANTGPSGDHTTGTGFYLFTEASSPQVAGDKAILEGPCFDLAGKSSASFSFWFHMFGAGIGLLDVQVSEDCLTWTNLLRLSGDQGNSWFQANVDLTGYIGSNVKLRFVGTRGPAATSDMAIDDLMLTAAGCLSDGDCDDGNSCTVDVCNAETCEYTPESVGTVCRASVGECDNEETCDGTTAPCPNDGFVASGTSCTDSAPGDCDDAQCDGNGACDQAFAIEANGYVCRADNLGGCDVAEACDGASGGACPADLGVSGGTECRASTGECDLAETCDGSSAPCPSDSFVTAGTPCTDGTPNDCDNAQCDGAGACNQTQAVEANGYVCRADNGSGCDVAESCDGVSGGACANDAFVTAGTQCADLTPNDCDDAQCDGAGACNQTQAVESNGYVCRADNLGGCDAAEACDGVSGGACPADDGVPNGTVCRAAVGECDFEETCDGTSAPCPSDAVVTASTPCTDNTPDDCDDAQCDGTGACDQAFAIEAGGYVCRADNLGGCDVAETCDGLVGGACPADLGVGFGTICRGAIGECDLDETCDGSSAPCPSDGFVTAGTPCTDGTPDDCDDAQCDGAGACDQAFNVEFAGYVCRPDNLGGCDAAETCDGVSGGACPADAGVSAGTECRAAAGECDAAETCDGSSAPCPSDGFVFGGTPCTDLTPGDCDDAQCDGSGACDQLFGLEANGYVCRPDNLGGCDAEESCDGVSGGACPADDGLTVGTVCRPAVGECDLDEACDGSSAPCPFDVFVTAGVPCTDNTPDDCDDAQCDGAGACDPVFDFEANGYVCRTDNGGGCDVAETCDGISGGACPADLGVSAGTECRAAAGECDAAETCDGSSAPCPLDGFIAAGAPCTDSTPDDCDDAQCDGNGVCDPLFDVEVNGYVCRADNLGGCDVAEICDGISGGACPADDGATVGTVCRPAVGECDLDETCDGTSAPCPSDAFVGAGTPCADPAPGDCDDAQCDGNGACDPGFDVEGNGYICRADNLGGCDVAEACDGVNGGPCPTDDGVTVGTVCRAAIGECDLAETCDGSSAPCPTDVLVSAGTPCTDGTPDDCDDAQCDGNGACDSAFDVEANGYVCRADNAGGCDVAETCDGVAGGACPADLGVNSGTVCRAATGECDLDETCDGSSAPCPSDTLVTAGTACTDNTPDDCDDAQCDGNGACDPMFDVEGIGYICRADNLGGCDIADACDGVTGGACPADAAQPNGTICSAGGGECFADGVCDGTSTPCPGSSPHAAGTPCTDSTPSDCNDAQCDGAGACDQAFAIEADATACDDAVACTDAECQSGTCTFAAFTGQIDVDLVLEAVSFPVTRDVTFVVTTCGQGADVRVLPLSVDGVGFGTTTINNVDAAAAWLAAQEGHTLNRLVPLTFASCVATADLTGADRLRAGDFQTASVAQDNFIDITDFSILAVDWNLPIAATSSLGADATADGFQGTADFTTIQVNYLEVGDGLDGCPGGVTGTGRVVRSVAVPVDRLSVFAAPVSHAHRADLNGDGWIDGSDIVQFAAEHGLQLVPEFQERLLAGLATPKPGHRTRGSR